MTRKERIEATLAEAIVSCQVLVTDESRQHNVPKGAESHFNVLVVSDQFDGLNRVARHRMVHGALADEFAGGLHALTLTLRTPSEHEHAQGPIASPKCMGGSKA